ncbi:hypothetical protein PEX1_068110 [Penicillium expansum]|uniref:mRNA-capping enzyme subunit beta n=1 Tax=Penicillium expansum TaxID=27334 RepID=A0A0A2KSZ3_PENEN|nr:hypothetical protein PEX2_062970 [Penicillium expansum]KGO45143.1 hypothetical protein PEXP_091730 [Penicillium expansum]KGO53686.1 hypothetical protein PEX2_062970 [Penicillium expansum]KGO70048.1 hypothetical protein PEX1_068110 [Penicillium expansum]
MDLRTIMNTDGGASNPPPPSNSASSPISDQTPQKRPKKAASYSEYPTRPSQPPPLQYPQHASPERSSPYASVQSPYQQFNSGPVINTAVRSQRSQTPPHVSTSYGPGTRDPFGAPAYGSHPQHPGGPLVSPYTPQPLSAGPQHPEQQSYFAQQRSQQRSQSLQSVMTTPRAPVESFHSPPVASQPLPSQHFSPTAHRSIPGTPLGPPPAFATRQSPSTARPPSSGHDSPGNPLSSPRPTQEALIRDQVPTQSPVTQRQFSPHTSQPSEPTHLSSGGLKQEPTESASPKSISRHNSIVRASESGPASQIRSSEDRMLVESPTAQKPTVAGSDFLTSPLAPGSQMNSSPSAARGGAHAVDMEIDHEPRVDAQQPKQKRRRYNEPPIYARLTPRNTSKRPIIPNPRPPVPKHARQSQQDPSAAARRRSSSIKAVTPVARVTRAPAVASPSTSMPRVQATPAPPASSLRSQGNSQTIGSLGPWEPSITGFIPHEEITKTLCDFLFQHVVMRNDVNAGPAGSAAAGQGTIVEIEAKLGHIIDMDSRDRINLPILTESVLNRENARIRTSFESKMTVEQHRAMNNFLNEAVKASMPQPNSTRIPLAYVHKKERDTFYEIQAADLPPVIRQNLNPRHKPRVRVTTDERTGEILAKIVKCRVADVDVCSPRTTVDWRVSVNLEMEYTGDVSNLPVIDAAVIKGGRGDRIKDRMSYSHLAYQVDLTQVAKSDQQPGKNEFDHELEVEVSAEEIRRQGQLAMSGDPKNQYEDLVKGFVDNIRLLARAVPP